MGKDIVGCSQRLAEKYRCKRRFDYSGNLAGFALRNKLQAFYCLTSDLSGIEMPVQSVDYGAIRHSLQIKGV